MPNIRLPSDLGKSTWYEHYEIRIAKVERAYAGPPNSNRHLTRGATWQSAKKPAKKGRSEQAAQGTLTPKQTAHATSISSTAPARPFIKAGTKPGPFTPVDLAVQAGRPLLARQPFDPREIDDIILGCVNVHTDEVNPGRVAGLRLGCGPGSARLDRTAQLRIRPAVDRYRLALHSSRPCRPHSGRRHRGPVATPHCCSRKRQPAGSVSS